MGQHALACGHMKSRHSRHREMNDVISKALTKALLPNKLEPLGLLPEDNKRPDGLTVVPWSRGRSLAWDASCVHRLAHSWLSVSKEEGTPAADATENRKRAKYANLPSHIEFEPVVVETLGGLGSTTAIFIRALGKRLRKTTAEARSYQFLLQRLAIAVQRGNAGCILESLPMYRNSVVR